MNILIIAMFWLVTSCDKPEPMPPVVNPPVVDTTFQVVWKTDLGDVEFPYGKNMQLYKDLLIFPTGFGERDGTFPHLIAYNKWTGKKEWDYFFKGTNRYGVISTLIKDNVLFINTNTGLIGFDIETRTEMWEFNYRHWAEIGFTQLGLIGDYFYAQAAYRGDDWPASDSAYLARYHYLTGKKDWLVGHKIKDKEDPLALYGVPALWIEPNSQDSILVFIRDNFNYQYAPYKIPPDLVAFNLKTRKVEWEVLKFSFVVSQVGFPPTVIGDDVLVVSDWSVYKYHIPTGELIWRTELAKPTLYSIFNNTAAKLVDNLLVVQSGQDEAYAVDINSGAITWTNLSAAPNANYHILHQDDMLIMNSWGNGSIVALDPKTGKTLIKQRSPNESISFSGEDVIYDKETKLYYTSDYKSIFGFKLNRPK